MTNSTKSPLSLAQIKLLKSNNNNFHNIFAAYRLTGSLNVLALDLSLNEMVRRHETLRTSFPIIDGQTVPIIAPSLTLTIPVVDWRQLSEEELSVEVQKLAMEEIEQPFDLTYKPLLRVTLLRIGEQEHVLFIVMHHLISDRSSIEAFISEMGALYQTFSIGKASELPQLMWEWNDTKADFPLDQCFPQLFEAQVVQTPQSIAVAFADQQLTYQELNARANRWARHLVEQGVGEETIVALLCERNIDFLTAMLAIFKAGGAYLPLNPHHPSERIQQVLEQSQVPLVLTASYWAPIVSSTVTSAQMLQLESFDSQDYSSENLPARCHPEKLAYVIYTSGSTGKPKGAMLEHQGMLNHLYAKVQDLQLSASDVVAQTATQTFDISIWQFLVALLVGGRVEIVSTEIAADPSLLMSLVQRQQISILEIVPSLLRMILQYLQAGNIKPAESKLRWLLLTGETLPPQLCRQWFEYYPHIPMMNAYGPTECSDDVTHYPIYQPPAETTINLPIGRPVANTQLYILDDQLKPVAIGVPGELYVGGIGVGRGYLYQPQLTEKAFIADPFREIPGARLYKTGDKARYLSDGNIEFLGRIDYQVKIRGFRIELGEIEAVLAQQKEVREAVVIAREEQPGNQYLVAYVVSSQEITPSELRDLIKQKLPDYMVPTAFVMLDSLPLTPNGKVDRRALPAPEFSLSCDAKYVAPYTSTQAILVKLWSEVLNLKQIGIHDNFFEMGGHSLLATQVISRLRSRMGVELPLRRLFELPTVAQLSELLEGSDYTQGLQVPTIAPVPRGEYLPLSFAQGRLWFLNQLEGETAIYNMAEPLRLIGSVNIAVLEMAVQEIVQRHEILRTTFKIVNGSPVQVIAPSLTINLPVVDLQHLPQEQSNIVQELAIAEAQQPFDLSNGPLLRVTLLRLSEQSYVLLLTMHHIVSDGWSMGVFIDDLSSLYQAFCAGEASKLPQLSIQYADFTHWQQQWLNKEVLQTQLNYWKLQLAGAPPLLELPTDRPRPSIQTWQGNTKYFQINQELTQKLKILSQQSGVTLFMTLLAAFSTLLSRYSGQEDIIVGSPIANRNRSEVETLIGFFVNTLVLRTQVQSSATFLEQLEQVREITLGAYAHQDLPFEKLVEELQPERSLSYSPLYQVMFVLQNAPIGELELPGLSMTPLQLDDAIATEDLFLSLTETQEGLAGKFIYNTDLFDAATIERMAGHLQILLESIVANPQQRVGELQILDENEYQQLLFGWNDTNRDYPLDVCFPQLFEAQVARTPDAIAVVFADQQLTYQQLNARANQWAWHLVEKGVCNNTVVALLCERNLDFLTAILAIFKAGGAYLPLNANHPVERMRQILEQSQAPRVLVASELKPMFSKALDNLETTPPQVLRIEELELPSPSQSNLPARCQPQDLAYVIYTSGSTGTPKGAMLEHRGMLNHLYAKVEDLQLSSSDVVAQTAPVSFDISVWQFLVALLVGGRVYIVQEQMMVPTELLGIVEQQKISILEIVPSLLRTMLQEIELYGSAQLQLSRLRWLLLTGEALAPQLCRQWFEHYPTIPMLNAYGPTECSDDVTHYPIYQAPEAAMLNLPIGRPVLNTQLYIVDSQLQPVPIGVPGELYVGGVGVGRGYLNQPQLTQKAFVPDPFTQISGARLYKTGDKARYLGDGNIEFLGRIDYQVKIRGFRIELGEIAAILEQHPQVQEAVVIAREDQPGNQHLVAYVVPNEEIATNELRDYLKQKLPNYMVPSAVVSLEKMPLTPNGKVDRRALPIPDLQISLSDNYVAPRTPTQEVLAQLWAEVLSLEIVGIHNNFFELGGHSLLATQVISRLRSVFGIELPLRCLFESPTIAELSEKIEAVRSSGLGLAVPTIEAIPRNTDLPLSFAQTRLWFLNQLEGETATYNIPEILHLTGSLNIEALKMAVQEIVHRHEILRTTFKVVNGSPVQVIADAITLTMPVVDLQHLPEQEQSVQWQQLALDEIQQLFDLSNEPLVRVKLLRLAEQSHVLLVTMHHIVSDGWSMGVFVNELSTIYQAFSIGEPSPLEPLALQYADFAHWQRQWFSIRVLHNQLNYWKQQLADAPPLLELPTDRPRPSIQTFQGSTKYLQLNQELTQQLKKLSQRSGTTLFMTLLAAFCTLMYRYSGQEDVIVGSPIANRNQSETEPLIGLFVNTLVLRTQININFSFLELLEQVRETTLGAYAHQDLPFEKLVEELQPQRSLSYSPLFQVMFGLQNAPMGKLELPELSITPLQLEDVTSTDDLLLLMAETEGALTGELTYNTDLFDATTIERMMGHFQILLESIVADPKQKVAQLSLLSAKEHQQLVLEWNDTEAQYSLEQSFPQLFAAQVARTPDAIAVVFEDKKITYQQLNARANQWAWHLVEQGICANTVLALLCDRNLDFITAILAIFKAGGAYLPLNSNHPVERMRQVLEQSQVSKVLVASELEPMLSKAVNSSEIVPQILKIEELEARLSSPENLPVRCQPQDLAYVIYTSGSTGTPKGAMLEHRGMLNHLYAKVEDLQLTNLDVVAQTAPVSFDISVWQFLVALLIGGRVYIVEEQMMVPNELLGIIENQQVSILEIVPSLLRTILQEIEVNSSQNPQLSSLRWLLLTGEALPPQLCREWFEYYPTIPMLNAYGPTECSDDVTHYPIYEAPELEMLNLPIGRPVINTQLYILDTQLQPVPTGVAGELYVGGVGVGRGYLNQPQLTEKAFVADPFSQIPGARLYKTGDKARYLPDGNIEFLGRIDYQVKIRGFRIELGEIEAVLAQHPQVKETVVIATEDQPGNQHLVAYVVLDQEIATSELRDYLKQKLPNYMVPSAVVSLDKMPLTPNGKIDRRALPAPDIQLSLNVNFVAPHTPTQEVLANMWAEILGLERVGIDNNFFELGGHSLLATQVISRVRSVFGVDLPLRRLFESPTIAELSQAIEEAHFEGLGLVAPTIEAIPRNTNLPVSFAQTRLWFLNQLEGDTGTYNIPEALHLNGNLNAKALFKAVQEITQRHEVLRTTFLMVNGEPVQVIVDTTIPIQVVDLQSLPEEEKSVQVQQWANSESVKPFDLSNGPLLRIALLRLSEKSHVLLLTMHHIVSDGWSMGVLVQELSTLYQAFDTGKPSELPDLAIQYADFAHWQRQWLRGEVLQTQLDYWKQQLAEVPPLLELPTDHPRPSVQTFQGNSREFQLNQELAQQLKKLSQQSGTTLFMTLLAAFSTLLSRYSGQSDIVIGSPIANRNQREVEPLIGLFVNTLVLRTKIEGDPTFFELLERVRETTLGAYAHQDLPFEKLVEELQPERSLSYSPLFQVMFVLQNTPMGELELPGLSIAPLEVEEVTAKFDLTLFVEESKSGLRCGWEYNTDLFDTVTIERMAGHFQILLESIVANPNQHVAQLSLLSQAEQHQLLFEWNDTLSEYPQHQCFPQLFEAQVTRTPDAVAVVFADEQLTYQQLNARANQLAWHLVEQGVGANTVVALLCDRNIDFLTAMLAVFKAGGAYLPLNANHPVERMRQVFEQSQVSKVLVASELVPMLSKALDNLEAKPQILQLDKLAAQRQSPENLPVRCQPQDLAYIIYTSGSTGKPKGAMLEHRGMLNHLYAKVQDLKLSNLDVVAQTASVTFDISIWQFLAVLLVGGQVYIVPEEIMVSTKLLAMVEHQQISILEIVPSLLRAMLQQIEANDSAKPKLSHLRWLLLTGEALPPQLCREWFAYYPTIPMLNAYGPTECSDDVTHYPIYQAPELEMLHLPIGRPVSNTQLYILDSQLQPLPIGVAGELYVGGVGVGRGYLNQPELTEKAFIANQFTQMPGARLYKTGDKARYLADGNIEFLGRMDYQVKIRGFRIELGEIEAVLAQHPQVKEVVVIVKEDQPGNKRLVAYFVPNFEPSSLLNRDDEENNYKDQLTTNELRGFLKENLPDYMVPSAFVSLVSMPLTPNGKIDRKALFAFKEENLELESTFAAPSTPVEEMLAGIWAEILGLEQVGIHHNFFELGGHSLLATQVISRIYNCFQIELPLRTLFERQTIADLAVSVVELLATDAEMEEMERILAELEEM